MLEPNESILLQVFVLNEIVVGAYIIINFIYTMFCSALSKYENLIEMEGNNQVDDAEV